MKSQISASIVAVAVAVAAAVVTAAVARAGRVRRADDTYSMVIDLTPTLQKGAVTCTTKDDKEGVCVFEAQCDEAHSIVPGGIIEDTDLREKKRKCPGKFDWCCTLEKVKAAQNKTKVSMPVIDVGCSIVTDRNCPWCVAIYRKGGNPRTRAPSGLFCAGALVGRRAVLTAGGCVLAARGLDAWVRVPASGNPTYDYTITSSLNHTNYNSGTRENDVGLMILSEDVVWDGAAAHARGACLGFRTSLAGNCHAVGFSQQDDLVVTSMMVTSGGCSNKPGTYDAACGRSDGVCNVLYGSPVLCPSSDGANVVVGVARSRCKDDSALLGSLQQSARWVQEELTRLGLVPYNYTIGI